MTKKEDNSSPLAPLETEIRMLSTGVRRLLERTDLTEDALVMLIQAACGGVRTSSHRYRYAKLNRKTILAVLHAAAHLDEYFLKSAQERVAAEAK